MLDALSFDNALRTTWRGWGHKEASAGHSDKSTQRWPIGQLPINVSFSRLRDWVVLADDWVSRAQSKNRNLVD